MHLSLYFVLFQASMRGKSRETKANMGIKEALPGCDEFVNGPLESISSDLALDTLAEGLVVSCVGGTLCISRLEGMC
ncbi:BnaA05g18220D [Brassica napus]|uniref:BnaA05g18220D protein n=2 Tax=Brassica TaxID=3705 RepID=A0A078GUV5_BRANA|nr:BnaA05g18220D [Brassica napus]VDC71530.1 unnamed protein product [Brassica rapa]